MIRAANGDGPTHIEREWSECDEINIPKESLNIAVQTILHNAKGRGETKELWFLMFVTWCKEVKFDMWIFD